MQQHEIPGHINFTGGNGGLTKVVVTTKTGMAEIYPHGAHITAFQKNGEPPLIFVSRKSYFASGNAIRGGVPICFPWFGSRDGEPSHGLARITEWQLVKTFAATDGSVTLQFSLPGISGNSNWNSLRTDFWVTVSDKLTMELATANESC
ncbi:MAG TPA: D-hexose-6-phosphate mutarotase, partial [Candidatus Paceibacterota bacterium]|nr:D-hexose-6-phosphate mutarotase [Candidatus Paceibacterota bacterium]